MVDDVPDLETLFRLHRTNLSAVARACGVSRAALWKVKAGETRTMLLATARRIADALGVSLETVERSCEASQRVAIAERARRAEVAELIGGSRPRRRRDALGRILPGPRRSAGEGHV